MSANNGKIPDVTIQAVCRAFYRESNSYGFAQIDYVKFVNALLDMAMKAEPDDGESNQPDNHCADGPPAAQAAAPIALPLRGERIVVRRFNEEQDLPLFDRWLADKIGRYFLLSRTSSERLEIRDVARSDNNVIGIVTLPDGVPIGSVCFLNLDPVQRKAELRKIIGEPDQRRKGLAKEASVLWIEYGLDGLGLRKIYLNTLNTDIRNIKLNEELGFAVEGVLRNEVLIDGSYCDVLRMGLWRD
jgi:RimJ/RimL family protein N-acetyltransferase